MLSLKEGRARARSLADKAAHRARHRLRRHGFEAHVELRERGDLIHLGTPDGGWTVPTELLGPDACCYLAGVGTDITFDLHLIARFGCRVHGFDPVPAAQRYGREMTVHEPRWILHPVGLWSTDTALRFSAPRAEGFVSHSATNMHGTVGGLDAGVRSVTSLMAELGHERLDLLKVSAEGSEYEILRPVLAERVQVAILCVEVAQPSPPGAAERLYDDAVAAGMDLVAATLAPWNWKLTFVTRRPLAEVT